MTFPSSAVAQRQGEALARRGQRSGAGGAGRFSGQQYALALFPAGFYPLTGAQTVKPEYESNRQDDAFGTLFKSGEYCLPLSLGGMFPLTTLEGIHALHAMDTPIAHRFAAAYMGAAEFTSWLQKHLHTQKQHRQGNQSEG